MPVLIESVSIHHARASQVLDASDQSLTVTRAVRLRRLRRDSPGLRDWRHPRLCKCSPLAALDCERSRMLIRRAMNFGSSSAGQWQYAEDHDSDGERCQTRGAGAWQPLPTLIPSPHWHLNVTSHGACGDRVHRLRLSRPQARRRPPPGDGPGPTAPVGPSGAQRA
jgi:hypothetical protein